MRMGTDDEVCTVFNKLYTFAKFVKKPAGAKPGMVIFTNNKTLYVTPDAETVEALRKEK